MSAIRIITRNIPSWWRHQMKTFSAILALCPGKSPVPVNSPHKGQWRGALMFSLIYAWITDWANNPEAGYLRRHRGHYGVIVTVSSAVVFSVKDCIGCSQGQRSLITYTSVCNWRWYFLYVELKEIWIDRLMYDGWMGDLRDGKRDRQKYILIYGEMYICWHHSSIVCFVSSERFCDMLSANT